MSPPPRPRSRLRRITRWAAILCTLVVGTYLLRRPLFERRIAGLIEGALAEELGGAWHVETVEGGWITDATVSGVRATTPPADGPVRDLSLGRAEITCTAFGLLAGMSSIRSVRVTGLVADIDLTRPARGTSGHASATGGVSDLLANLPREVPDVALVGAVTVRTVAGDVRCETLTVRGSTEAFAIDATRIRTRRGGESHAWTETAPVWAARFTRPGATRLSLVSADPAAGVEVRRLEIELAGPSGARIEVEAGVAGGMVRGTLAADGTHVEAKDLDLARVPPWVAAAVAVTLPKMGRLDATLDAGAAGPATVHVTGRDWTLPDLPPFTFEASVVLDAGAVRVASLDGVCGGVRVVGRAIVIDGADPWTLHAAAEVRVSTDDVAAALRAFGEGDFAGEMLDGEAPVAATATLSRTAGGAVELSHCGATAADTRIDATGSLRLPEKPADWRDARVAAVAQVTADLADATSERRFGAAVAGNAKVGVTCAGTIRAPILRFVAEGAALRVAGRDLSGVRASATLADGTLTLDEAAATDAAGTLRASGTLVPATGEIRGAKIDGDLTQLAALLGDADRVGRAPTIDGTVHITVRLGRAASAERPQGTEAWLRGVTGTVDATCADLIVDVVHVRSFAARVVLDGPRATLASFTASMPGAAITAHGHADLVTGRVSGLGAVATVENLGKWAADLAAAARDAPTPPGVGGHGSATVNVPDFAVADLDAHSIAPDGTRLDVVLEDATLGDSALGVAKLSATVTSGVVGFAASLAGATVALDANGTLAKSDEGFRVTLIEASASGGALSARLGRSARVDFASGRIDLAETVIDLVRDAPPDAAASDAPSGRITVRGSLGDTLDLEVGSDDFDAGLVAEEAAGAGRVRARATGSPARPDLAVSADFPSLRFLDLDGSIHVVAHQDADGVHLTRVEASAVAKDAAAATADDAPAPGPRSERAARRAAPRAVARRDVPPRAFRLDASGDFPWRVGTAGVEQIAGRSPAFAARLRTDDAGPWIALAGIDGLSLPATDIALAWQDGVGTLDCKAQEGTWTPGGLSQYAVDGALTVRARIDGASASVEVDGTSSIGSSVRGRAVVRAGIDWDDPAGSVRRILDAPLEGEVAVDVPDISPRREAMPDVAEIAGRATGNVVVAGTLSRPALTGRFDATGVAFRAEGSGQGFDHGVVHVAFAGREIRVEKLEGRLGYGPVAVTGTITLPADGDPVADLRVHGENVLVAQSDTVRIRADADLRVTGPLSAPVISGDAVIRDALAALELATASQGASGARGVHFFELPPGPLADAALDVHVTADRTIRIVSDRVRGVASADLRIRGKGDLPEPEGRVDFPGLRVMLPFSLFTVETGSLEFPRAAPFAPRVFATAQFRARDYDVTARVSGDVSALQIDVTTVPSLPREDALLLVVTGASPKDLQAGGFDRVALSRAQSLVGSELLAQLVRPADPMERSFIDRISLDVSRSRETGGSDRLQASYELEDDLLIRIERDQYLNFNLGLVMRIRFR